MDRPRPNRRVVARWLAGSPLAAVLAGCGSSASVPAPLPPATFAAYPGGGELLVVDAGWLRANRTTDGGGPVVLDASTPAEYRAGHIPGAVHAWWQDTMDPNGPVYGTVFKPDQNAADPQRIRRNFIEDIGVTPDDAIVVYDAAAGRRAARIVWTLRFLGYPKATLLDGGLGAWRGVDGDIEQRERGPRPISAAVVAPGSPQEAWYLVTDQLLARLGDAGHAVVDIRTDAERADDVDETIPLGTIPGAVRLPWASLVAPDGRLLPPEALGAAIAAAAVPAGIRLVLLGLFGTDTGLPWLALRLAGFTDVAVYDGGWNDWARRPDTPKTPLP